MSLVAKPFTVQIPEGLFKRVLEFEGGKYTPKSVCLTAIEEWLDAKAREKAAADAAAKPAADQEAR